jgi:hypothetical protein
MVQKRNGHCFSAAYRVQNRVMVEKKEKEAGKLNNVVLKQRRQYIL